MCSPWDLQQPYSSTQKAAGCLEACQLECKLEKFDVRSIPMAFDEKAVSRLLGGNYSDAELKRFMSTHSIVHVAFGHLEYTEVIQYFPMTLGTLMSNVGGLFGLLLGGSVLTLVHALMFLLQRLLTAASWKRGSIAANDREVVFSETGAHTEIAIPPTGVVEKADGAH